MSILFKIVKSPDIFDSSRAAQFHQEIENLIDAGVKFVLLDLKNVTFISSSGLMALVSMVRLTRSAGCKILLYSKSEQVRILLEMTGLDQVLETFNKSEGFQSLGSLARANVNPISETLSKSAYSPKLKSTSSPVQPASAR
ncbi:STAS domain-containing protein [Trichocoleus sp. DQ-A3]|uniref:STAS domain-containing protein n=1 Tax=Cyanophyceae TaxID=3028117 RepID=UPI0016837671|nr:MULTISPECIES: STAS domain-containing protein [unclassified Coleofasciculus]MBD1898444.1 STAS domain-containing protein [Coleofasciculus sp. FACHB-125]MBD2085095.1 STAS domain-containing protein [Coleofasciculus sp. FACHB-542]